MQKTESAAIDIATARPGAKVLGFGAVDVRKVESLQDAVERCVKELGGIDFVMYLTLILNSIDLLLKLKRHRRRESHFWMFFDDACLGLGADNANTNSLPSSAGAAGNFLASIIQLSTNAMKSVIDIDVLGSYNTLKATLPHLLVSASRSKKDGKPGICLSLLPLLFLLVISSPYFSSSVNNLYSFQAVVLSSFPQQSTTLASPCKPTSPSPKPVSTP